MAGPISSTPGVVTGLQSLSTTASDTEQTTDTTTISDTDTADTLSLSTDDTIASLNAVTASVDTATSTADLALAAGDEVSSLLGELSSLASTAAAPDTSADDLEALDSAFTDTLDAITAAVDSAAFEGTNALAGDAITAIPAPGAPETTVIEGADFSLGGDIISLTADTSIATPEAASAAIPAIDDAISAVSTSLSEISASASELSTLGDFTGSLSAAVDTDISGLIDSTLTEADVDLLASELSTELGTTPVSILNSAGTGAGPLLGSTLA